MVLALHGEDLPVNAATSTKWTRWVASSTLPVTTAATIHTRSGRSAISISTRENWQVFVDHVGISFDVRLKNLGVGGDGTAAVVVSKQSCWLVSHTHVLSGRQTCP